jgi:hypothetical protein
VLYCFFIISHDRRRILHLNVTKHPTSGWIIQQLREAFPFGSAPRFLIFERMTTLPRTVRIWSRLKFWRTTGFVAVGSGLPVISVRSVF